MRSSVQHLLRSAYALLDTSRPIVGLRQGGVGVKERQRLGKALGVGEDDLLLVLDLLFAAELLVQVGSAFEVTARYEPWRQATPASNLAAPATVTASTNASVIGSKQRCSASGTTRASSTVPANFRSTGSVAIAPCSW
jgi:hypothetical protein